MMLTDDKLHHYQTDREYISLPFHLFMLYFVVHLIECIYHVEG